MKRRVAATQKTLDRYKDKTLKLGRRDCGQMARSHLILMGKPVKGWAKAGTYNTPAGAVKQLKKLGFDTVREAMDASFERIPPAAARVGDIIELPSEQAPGALTIALGNGKILCFVEGVARVCVPEGQFEAAWRVPVEGEQ